jgi:hypothetical protein
VCAKAPPPQVGWWWEDPSIGIGTGKVRLGHARQLDGACASRFAGGNASSTSASSPVKVVNTCCVDASSVSCLKKKRGNKNL